MTRLRFVHAADLHLDSPFRGIRGEAPDYVAETLHRATFDAYDNIVALCLAERVDALLVAGDIYDGADRSLRAQLKFVGGLERLDAAGIRSFVCHGNHDPLDGWEARLALPEGCVRFGPEVTAEPVFPDEPGRATVYGVSYPQRVVEENLSLRFREIPAFAGMTGAAGMAAAGDESGAAAGMAVAGDGSGAAAGMVGVTGMTGAGDGSGAGCNIGLLHANVGGNTGHDNYSPCTVADLAEAGLDYWALGHVHTRQVLRQERPTVVYPGNPQGRHPLETGERGVYLVEVDDYGAVSLDFRPVDVVRWENIQVDIAGLDTEQELLYAIEYAANSCGDAAGSRPVVCRLALTGRGTLHRWLRRAGTVDELRERFNNQYGPSTSSGQPWLWCERIQADTASPVDREQVALREDFIGDLARIAEELRETPGELAELRRLLRPLYESNRTRHYLRNLLPDDDELRSLVSLAEEVCLSGLLDEEDEE